MCESARVGRVSSYPSCCPAADDRADPKSESSMQAKPNGELVPLGGGDNIPLLREHLTMGRRESCDICMRFPSVSGVHCELRFKEGYWYIKDLNSTNGIKVNG